MDVTTVKAAYQQLTSAELGQCRSRSMKSLDENLKFTWLIAHYGARIVLPLLIATQRMPRSLTDHQKLKYLRDAIKPVEASEIDIEAVHNMLTQECLNLTSELDLAIDASSTLCSTFFAPPTRECITCQRRLVSYHTTDTRAHTHGPIEYLFFKYHADYTYVPVDITHTHTHTHIRTHNARAHTHTHTHTDAHTHRCTHTHVAFYWQTI